MVFNAFYFFQLLRRRIILRQKYSTTALKLFVRPLLQKALSSWKAAYSQLMKKILKFRYSGNLKFLRHVLLEWRNYLQDKYFFVLKNFQTWRSSRFTRLSFFSWKNLFVLRKRLAHYESQYSEILLKYNFKHWKLRIHKEKRERNNILFIWVRFFFKKYFTIWYKKVFAFFDTSIIAHFLNSTRRSCCSKGFLRIIRQPFMQNIMQQLLFRL